MDAKALAGGRRERSAVRERCRSPSSQRVGDFDTAIDQDAEKKSRRFAERQGCGLHVDASYGGTAAILPRCATCSTDATGADSLVVNPQQVAVHSDGLLGTVQQASGLLSARSQHVPEFPGGE